MPEACCSVLRDVPFISEIRFREIFGADVADSVARHGKAELAGAMRRCPRSIDNMMTGGKAGPDAVFALLSADPSSFGRLQQAFGLSVSRRGAVISDVEQMGVAALLCAAGSKLISALADGKLDHQEKIEIAEVYRPLIPLLLTTVEEVDALRGPRKVA